MKIGDDEDAEEAIAAAEERKRIRKLRSRRDRSKNGAQFTQTLYPDFRQVRLFDKILLRPPVLFYTRCIYCKLFFLFLKNVYDYF